VSAVSATLIEVQMRTKDTSSKLRTLVLFLRQNRIEPRLSNYVKQQVEKRIQRTKLLADEEVPALALLPSSQQAQLHFARSKSSFMNHPLFRLWIQLSDRTAKHVCSNAIAFKVLRSMDDLFMAGSSSAHAYHLVRGVLMYHQDQETSMVNEQITSNVQEGSWICEAALWTQWQHVGTASTLAPCQLMALDAERMVASLGTHRLIRDITQQYAQEFQRRLAAAVAPFWPSDIHVPSTDFGSIVHSMDHQLQALIGLNSLKQLPWLFDSFLGYPSNNFLDEVMKGRCAVVVNCDDTVERIVRVAALRIVHKNGLVLTQLGHFEGESFTAACLLPGTKLERGETHQDGVARVLSARLNPLSDAVTITSSSEEEASKGESLKFRVKTRYYRTVCSAKLSAAFSVPVVWSVPHTARRSFLHSIVTGENPQLLADMLRSEIYAIAWDDGRLGIYTWILERDLEFLQSPRIGRHVDEWAKTLTIDRDVLETRRCRVFGEDFDITSNDSWSDDHTSIPDEF